MAIRIISGMRWIAAIALCLSATTATAQSASLIENGVIAVEGNTIALEEMMSLFDSFEFWFNIVTP